MSLVNDFMANCPLTPKKLQEWLQKIIAEIEKSKTFTFDGISIIEIMSKNKNSVINDVCSVDDFNAIFDAVKNGNTLKLMDDNGVCIISMANTIDMPISDYKYVYFNFFGTFQSISESNTFKHFKIGMEMLAGSIRLCDKSITEL